MAGGGKDKNAQDLEAIRKRINDIDERLQSLISERAKIAHEVGVAKGDLGSAVDYYRPEREAEVLRQVLERNDGPTETRTGRNRIRWLTLNPFGGLTPSLDVADFT